MSLKQRVFINTFWSIGGQIGISLIQLIANIIFARLLSPIEFGQIGIVMFFVLFSNVLIEGGLGGALVRKIDATERDFSTVFIFNFFVSLFLYFLLIINVDNISNYYNDPVLRKILMVVGGVFIVNSLIFVQNTRLVKNLKFKKIATYKFISIFSANSIGIILAVYQYGIWSMVVAIVANPMILAFILWTKEGPIGKLIFSKKSFKGLYAFGVNTSLASIIDTAFNNIYQLILGKYFSISEVGLFFQAKKLQDVPNFIITGTTNSVIFSSLAGLQNERERFISVYNKIILFFSILMGMITLITIVFAKEIIIVLYGNQWIESGSYLIMLAAASFFYVHEMFNRVIFKTFDKTKLILQLELIKKSIVIVSIIIGIIFLSIKVLLIGFIVVSFISYFINYLFSRKIIGSKSWDELKSILKIFLAVTIITMSLHFTNIFSKLTIPEVILIVPLVIVIYIILLWVQGIRIDVKEFILFFRSWKINKNF